MKRTEREWKKIARKIQPRILKIYTSMQHDALYVSSLLRFLCLFLFLSLPVKEFCALVACIKYVLHDLSTSTAALLPSLFIDIEALHSIQRLELEALKKLAICQRKPDPTKINRKNRWEITRILSRGSVTSTNVPQESCKDEG